MNTDVEDLLREGMERFAADLRAPGGMTRRAVRRRRRRLALRSVAGAGAALTACAVTLVAAGVPGARHDGTEGQVVPSAYVVKRVDSALSAAEPGAIAQMTVTIRSAVTPGGKTAATSVEEWSFGHQWRSATTSPAGRRLYDEGSSTASVFTLVNYLTRTWARKTGLGRPAAPVSGPRSCKPVVAALPVLFRPGLPGVGFPARSPATVARALRTAISCGTLAVAGRQRVGGIEAIELTSRPNSPISETIWVSPGTYLPVRVVVRSAHGMPFLRQTADITWLPPTVQNLAKLTVPVPGGFRRVSLAAAVTTILLQGPGLLPKLMPLYLAPAGPGRAFAVPLPGAPILPPGAAVPCCRALLPGTKDVPGNRPLTGKR